MGPDDEGIQCGQKTTKIVKKALSALAVDPAAVTYVITGDLDERIARVAKVLGLKIGFPDHKVGPRPQKRHNLDKNIKNDQNPSPSALAGGSDKIFRTQYGIFIPQSGSQTTKAA